MSWESYYKKTSNRPVRSLFEKAIKYLVNSTKTAMDLGCGDGTEVIELLKLGYDVHAVDQENKFLEAIDLKSKNVSKLHSHVTTFENFNE